MDLKYKYPPLAESFVITVSQVMEIVPFVPVIDHCGCVLEEGSVTPELFHFSHFSLLSKVEQHDQLEFVVQF